MDSLPARMKQAFSHSGRASSPEERGKPVIQMNGHDAGASMQVQTRWCPLIPGPKQMDSDAKGNELTQNEEWDKISASKSLKHNSAGVMNVVRVDTRKSLPPTKDYMSSPRSCSRNRSLVLPNSPTELRVCYTCLFLVYRDSGLLPVTVWERTGWRSDPTNGDTSKNPDKTTVLARI